jgi:hypothetical protein
MFIVLKDSKDSKIQGFKDSRIQGFKDSDKQED